MLGCASRRSSALLLTAVGLTLLGCERPTDPDPGEPQSAQLTVSANVAATTIAAMVVRVTAPDIATALVFNLPIAGGTATGSIVLPAGSNRKLEFEAFDENHILTHRAEKTITVTPGQSSALTIVLVPTTGQQPVIAHLGTFIVTITAASSPTLPLSVGAQLQLTATITDNASQPITPAPSAVGWATTHPAFFTVDGSGLVTAVKAGTGSVVATYNGFAGTFTVTVQ